MSPRPARTLWRVPLGLALAAVLWPAPPAEGQLLGRLFMTPEERQALDKQRYATPVKPEPEAPPEAQPEEVAKAPPPLNTLRMEGLVVRSRGPNTAWVDGAAVSRRGSTPQGVAVDPSANPEGGVTITVPGVDGPISLKPGQQFDPATARVMEFRPGRPEPAEPDADADADADEGESESPPEDGEQPPAAGDAPGEEVTAALPDTESNATP